MDNFKKSHFKNGLVLISQKLPWVNSVSIYVVVNAGPAYETEETSGMAHFLEHMLFEGTKKHTTAKELANVIESKGGRSGAWTDKEYIAYNVKIPKEFLDVGFYYLHEILFNSRLDKKSVEIEKKIILEEIQRKEDNPEMEIFDQFMEYSWGKNQSLGRSTLGNKTNISKIDHWKLIKYIEEFYTPSNMTIAVVGNFQEARMRYMVEEYFKVNKSGKKRIPQSNELRIPKVKSKKINSKSQQSQLIIGAITDINYAHQDRFAMRVLTDILSFGVSSRLFNRLVYELGISYSPGIINWVFKDFGVTMVYGGFSPENIDLAKSVIFDEINKLRKEKISLNELSTAKVVDIANMYYSLETPDAIAWWLATSWAAEEKILTPDQIKNEIEKVTVEDIIRVANKYLNKDKLITLVRGT